MLYILVLLYIQSSPIVHGARSFQIINNNKDAAENAAVPADRLVFFSAGFQINNFKKKKKKSLPTKKIILI